MSINRKLKIFKKCLYLFNDGFRVFYMFSSIHVKDIIKMNMQKQELKKFSEYWRTIKKVIN